jgi:hypothetical protein
VPFDATPSPDRSIEEIRAATDGLIWIEAYLQNGQCWTRYQMRDRRGRVCLLGAVVDAIPRSRGATRILVREYLARASHIGTPPARVKRSTARDQIIAMNDSCQSFEHLRARLMRARELAVADLRKAAGLVGCPPANMLTAGFSPLRPA